MDFRAVNQEVKQWSKKTIVELLAMFSKLSIVHRDNSPSPKPSKEALEQFITNRQGVANKITFKFPRHMVFVHKGVGKGTPIDKVGSTNRKAKEWFNPVIDKNIDDLADALAEKQADLIVNNIEIR